MNQEAIRNAGRIETAREEIVERMSRLLPKDGRIDLVPGLLLIKSSVPAEPVQSLFQPSFCFVAQGRKRASVGGEVFLYDPFHYLIFTVDLPVTAQASPDTAICGGQNMVLTASGGTAYLWSNGDTTSSITVNPLSSTSYLITVSSGACSDTASPKAALIPRFVSEGAAMYFELWKRGTRLDSTDSGSTSPSRAPSDRAAREMQIC